MKECTCAFTGHREIPSDVMLPLADKLQKEIEALIKKGYNTFVAGGAIGFDTMAADAVLGLREIYPEIKLHLVLPCKAQDKYWNPEQKAAYARILDSADSHEYTCESYTRYCMAQRNKRMVELSSAVIAFFNGENKGGTAMTVKIAKQKQVELINLY